MQKQATYVHVVFKIYHHMALKGLWHIKEELCERFSKFSNKVPKKTLRTWRITMALNRVVTTCRLPLQTIGGTTIEW